MPLFRFASAASRESLVWAANKQRQGDAYRAAALSVSRFRVLWVLVSSFIPALLAFGFLSGSAKSQSSPVCGFAANSGGGSVVLLGFA